MLLRGPVKGREASATCGIFSASLWLAHSLTLTLTHSRCLSVCFTVFLQVWPDLQHQIRCQEATLSGRTPFRQGAGRAEQLLGDSVRALAVFLCCLLPQ